MDLLTEEEGDVMSHPHESMPHSQGILTALEDKEFIGVMVL